jgi:hypothetical protein
MTCKTCEFSLRREVHKSRSELRCDALLSDFYATRVAPLGRCKRYEKNAEKVAEQAFEPRAGSFGGSHAR